MNRNNRGFMDTINNLQHMGDQMSKMFGGDFARQWMNGFGQPQGDASANQIQGGTSRSGPAQPSNGWLGGIPQGGAVIPEWLRNMPGLDGLTNFWGSGANNQNSSGMFPPVDVYETEHDVIVMCDVPGIERPAGIQVSVQTDRVVLRGDIKNANRSGFAPARSERHTGSFERVIDLPAAVDRSRARAVYKDGQLELRLPKLRGSKGQNGRSVQVDFL